MSALPAMVAARRLVSRNRSGHRTGRSPNFDRMALIIKRVIAAGAMRQDDSPK